MLGFDSAKTILWMCFYLRKTFVGCFFIGRSFRGVCHFRRICTKQYYHTFWYDHNDTETLSCKFLWLNTKYRIYLICAASSICATLSNCATLRYYLPMFLEIILIVTHPRIVLHHNFCKHLLLVFPYLWYPFPSQWK